MTDFALRGHGNVLILCARTERAKKRLERLRQSHNPAPIPDRLVLKRDQARELIDVLKFEGYGVAG
jgi:hypothetical protein